MKSRKRLRSQTPKQFCGIAKVKEAGVIRFVKYRFNNIDAFIQWCTNQYEVFFINIFYNRGPLKGSQHASFGKNKGLTIN